MPRSARVPDRSEVTEKRAYSPAFPPIGLSRIQAAHHCNVSTTLFDEMVRDGRMPQPKVIGSRVVWDRHKVEAFFMALPERGDSSSETDDEILSRFG